MIGLLDLLIGTLELLIHFLEGSELKVTGFLSGCIKPELVRWFYVDRVDISVTSRKVSVVSQGVYVIRRAGVG